MRKIAANYIFLPGFPLIKNGYVELDGVEVCRVVDTGGEMKEIAGLEFYGGMIVPSYVAIPENDMPSELLVWLEELYHRRGKAYRGINIIEGADLIQFRLLKNSRVRMLVK